MKLKKILSFALALAMVLAFIPAMSLTASAATESVLFDITEAGLSGNGDIALTNGGWTGSGAATFSGQWSTTGTWNSDFGDKALMFYRASASGWSQSDETPSATINTAATTKGAEQITIEYNFAMQDQSNNYQTWQFVDNDDSVFATVYYDQGVKACVGNGGADGTVYASDSASVYALRGTGMKIVATKGESNWTVTYSYESETDVYTEILTETVDSVNGFKTIAAKVNKYNNQYAAMALQGLKISYVMPDTAVSVTATYTVGGTTVATAVGTYDSTSATTASFAEQYYFVDGENALYHADATDLSEDTVIPMEALPNNDVSGYSKGASVTIDGTAYVVKSDNLIPNGDFYYGFEGWLDGTGAAPTNFTLNGDGTVTPNSSAGGATTSALHRSWAITPGSKYVFLMDSANATTSGNTTTLYLSSGAGTSYETATGSTVLVGVTSNGSVVGTLSSTWSAGTNAFVFDAGDSDNYASIWFRWIGSAYGNFGLYEIEVDSSVSYYSVSYAYEDGTTFYEESTKVASGTVIDGRTFYADGKIYTTPETTVEDADVVITATVAQEYAVLTDALVSDNEIWGTSIANNNGVFVAAGADANRGPLSDADGVSVTDAGINPSTLQKSRVGFMEFALPELEDGQTAQLVMPVYDWHVNTFSNGNTSIRISAYVMEDDSWTSLSDGETYTSSDVTTIGEVIFSDVAYKASDYITMDVTDAIKRAKAAGLSNLILRLNTAWGAAYISDSESAVFGGDREGLASYITISDGGYTVTVDDASTLTVNGSLMSDTTATVNDGDYIYAYGKDYYYEATSGTIYDGSTKIEVTSDLELTGMSLGVELVDGAQIRIGEGLDANDKITTDSGIRFIAIVRTENTLAVLPGAEIGIAIWDGGFEATPTQDLTADPATYGTPAVTQAADYYQDDDIFSLAITDIKEDNFNRIYVAAPYVVVNGEPYYGAAVARTPYEVAAGILTTGTTSVGGYEYSTTESEALIDVLNAYANQTGARITLTFDYEVGYATYANGADAFFTVASELVGDVCTITLTATNEATFYGYADEYYRVNNAHTAFESTYTDAVVTVSPDGTTMTIVFTVAE